MATIRHRENAHVWPFLAEPAHHLALFFVLGGDAVWRAQNGSSIIHRSHASTVPAKSSGGIESNTRQRPDLSKWSQVKQHLGGPARIQSRHWIRNSGSGGLVFICAVPTGFCGVIPNSSLALCETSRPCGTRCGWAVCCHSFALRCTPALRYLPCAQPRPGVHRTSWPSSSVGA